MNHKSDINLIHRYLTGECNREEEERVLEWMNADPANYKAVEEFRKIWAIEPRKELNEDIQMAWKRLEEQLAGEQNPLEADQAGSQMQHKRLGSKTTGLKTFFLRTAAVILLVSTVSLFFTDFRSGVFYIEGFSDVVMKEVVAERAHQTHLTFSDGSKVILNSDSRIRYPEEFDPGVREVYLEGEAYFEITRSENIEFTVQTNDTKIKVLGTKFNVKDRPEEREAEVVVSEGKVSIQSNIADSQNDQDDEVILTKGQLSTIVRGQSPSSPRAVDLNQYLTWLRGGIIFQEETLAGVFKKLERRFDVVFMVEDTTLLSTRFSGEFKNEPVEEILRLASQALEFRYEREDSVFTIRNRLNDD